MKNFWLLLLLTTACDDWGDKLDPVNRVEGVDDVVWHEEVSAASDTWRDMMMPGCYPFRITLDGECGNHVILVPQGEWTHNDSAGWYTSDGHIDIIGDSPLDRKAILMHEIGHAMGLDHNEDVGSIMNAAISYDRELTAKDVYNAEKASGCR